MLNISRDSNWALVTIGYVIMSIKTNCAKIQLCNESQRWKLFVLFFWKRFYECPVSISNVNCVLLEGIALAQKKQMRTSGNVFHL